MRTRLKRISRRVLRRDAPIDRAVALARWTKAIEPTDAVAASNRSIVLLNDCRDQISVGSNALTDGLIELLRRAVPDATILPIPSHWLVERSAWGAFVDGGSGFTEPRAEFPHVADQFETVAEDWLAGMGGSEVGEYIDRFRAADLLVLNGEGSLYRTNQSAVRELFLAWFAKTRLHVPTVYMNGGLHLTGVVPILPAIVRKTFPVLDAVAVREPCSWRNLKEYVPNLEAELVPDAAYVFTPADAVESEAVRRIRVQIGSSPYFCFDPGAMPMDARAGSRSAMYQLITRLREVVPTAVAVSHSPPDDYIASIAHETGSIYTSDVREYRAFMSLVSGAQFIVTGRHHNVILASIVGCPSIAFGGSTHKVHGVCEWLEGLVGEPFDGTHVRPQLDEIVARARSYVSDRDALRRGLLGVSSRLRDQTNRLGEIAASVIARPTQPSRTLQGGNA